MNNPVLDGEPFYDICMTLSSITISATIVINITVKNIAHITCSIIQKTQIRTETCEVI